ncbi:MAG: hypothetical protein JSS66_07375 [Armatimonadetes bacterium]|nr:hypothetical protein [Armatimonadota bacterium]
MSLEEKLMRAVEFKADIQWSYGQKWDRLRELLRGTPYEEEACCVIANGTANVHERPTASQQMAALKYELMCARIAMRHIFDMTAEIENRELAERIQEMCKKAGINKGIPGHIGE